MSRTRGSLSGCSQTRKVTGPATHDPKGATRACIIWKRLKGILSQPAYRQHPVVHLVINVENKRDRLLRVSVCPGNHQQKGSVFLCSSLRASQCPPSQGHQGRLNIAAVIAIFWGLICCGFSAQADSGCQTHIVNSSEAFLRAPKEVQVLNSQLASIYGCLGT